MDYDQLETFLILAKTKSFTKTAELLHVVQSTITSRIKGLEKKLEKRLFDRGTRYVELTPAGHVFLPYAQKLLDQMSEAITATQLAKVFNYNIVIGGLNSIWDSSVYYLVDKFYRTEKNAAIRLVTDHSDDLVKRISEGIVDIGFVYLPPRSKLFEIIPFKDESIVLVGNPEYAKLINEVSSSDLLSYNYLHINWGSPFTEWFEDEVGTHNINRFRVDHTGIALKMLTQQKFLGFILSSIAKEPLLNKQLKEIKYLGTKENIPKRTIYLIFLKRNTKTLKIQSFLNFLTRENHLNNL